MKVGHKARRGRKRNPVPHKQHRGPRGIGDPISRAFKREALRARERLLRPKYRERETFDVRS